MVYNLARGSPCAFDAHTRFEKLSFSHSHSVTELEYPVDAPSLLGHTLLPLLLFFFLPGEFFPFVEQRTLLTPNPLGGK